MSRRSARLVSGGYYQSDEDSDSSNVSISYRESPVRVFNKRRSGVHKAASRTSSRANSTASTASTSHTRDEPIINAVDYIGMGPWKKTQTFGAPSSMTPAPATVLAPALAVTPRVSLAPPSLHTSSEGLSSQSSHLAQSRSSFDSSGYSSSDGHHNARTTTSTASCGLASSPAATQRGTMDMICSYAGVRKAILLVLLFILLTLGIWYLFPVLIIRTQNFTIMNRPVPRTLDITSPSKETDVTAVINAALEDKINNLLREIELLKRKEHQQILVSEMVQRLQSDITNVGVRVKSVESAHRTHLDQEMADLRAELTAEQAGTHSITTMLDQEMADLRAEHTSIRSITAMLSQEMADLQAEHTNTQSIATTLNQEIADLKRVTTLLRQRVESQEGQTAMFGQDCRPPMADRMPDFALESQGASVVSTRCSETYRTRSACVTLFGFPLWYPSESPRTVIQGHPVLLPGKCWAFHGAQGSLVIALSHPIQISHVTLDHLPRFNSPTGHIDSAPKDFQVYGMSTEGEEGKLLGTFTYDQEGESIQTFKLPDPNGEVYRYVELRILCNWGHLEYTCVYRFRVHGQIASM